jgi:hypothetical protein
VTKVRSQTLSLPGKPAVGLHESPKVHLHGCFRKLWQRSGRIPADSAPRTLSSFLSVRQLHDFPKRSRRITGSHNSPLEIAR